MSFNNINLWIIGTELAVLLIFYFSTYDPLKKREFTLKGKSKIIRLKRYYLNNSIKDIKNLLFAMLLMWLLAIFLPISLLFISQTNSSLIAIFNFILAISVIFYIILVSILFFSYTAFYRVTEHICEAKREEEILSLLNVKKKYIPKIKKMLDTAFSTNESYNELAGWFIDSIQLKDKRIKKK